MRNLIKEKLRSAAEHINEEKDKNETGSEKKKIAIDVAFKFSKIGGGKEARYPKRVPQARRT